MLSTRNQHQNKRYTQTKNKKYGKRLHSVSANRNEKKAGVATFMLEKIDFKTDSIERDKKKKKTFYNAKGINPKREYNPCKHICTQYRST